MCEGCWGYSSDNIDIKCLPFSVSIASVTNNAHVRIQAVPKHAKLLP